MTSLHFFLAMKGLRDQNWPHRESEILRAFNTFPRDSKQWTYKKSVISVC